MAGTIYNQTELENQITSTVYTNVTGDVSGDDVQQAMLDMVASLQSYPGVITGDVVDNIAVSGTPIKLVEFNMNTTGENDVLRADQANANVDAKEPALYFVTVRFFGKWSAGEDLTFELRVNDLANPITPVSFQQEGQGANDPIVVSVTDIAFIVNSSMIAAGPGSLYAPISLWLSSTTGTFNVDQVGVTFGVEYNPLSIRTVG